MHIEEYVKDKHQDYLMAWLKARKMPPALAEDVPSIGLILFEGSLPIAIAFVRQAEGDIGYFEGLCTNPNVAAETRNIAVDALVLQIIETAKEFKMRMIRASTADNNTLTRALRHGFRKLPGTMIAIELQKVSTMH